jgi:catechol 2,3-dioxygenase-like lactoylglutathione lyase family enzyme
METALISVRQVVLDCPDARRLAEFYRLLLELEYRPGDDPPAPGEPDPNGTDWLVLRNPANGWELAFQQVPEMPPPTWPTGPRPQMAHLDLTVADINALDAAHRRAVGLGAWVLRDRSADPEEALMIYADPAGHPFCIFVPAEPMRSSRPALVPPS